MGVARQCCAAAILTAGCGRGADEKEGDGGNDGRGEDARRREDACLRERKEPEQKRHRDSERRGPCLHAAWPGLTRGAHGFCRVCRV